MRAARWGATAKAGRQAENFPHQDNYPPSYRPALFHTARCTGAKRLNAR